MPTWEDSWGAEDWHREREAHYVRSRAPIPKNEAPQADHMSSSQRKHPSNVPPPPPKDSRYQGENQPKQDGPLPRFQRKQVNQTLADYGANIEPVRRRPVETRAQKIIQLNAGGKYDPSTIRSDMDFSSRPNSSSSFASFASSTKPADGKNSSAPKLTRRRSSFSEKIKDLTRRISNSVKLVSAPETERNRRVVAEAHSRNSSQTHLVGRNSGEHSPILDAQDPYAGIAAQDFAENRASGKVSGLTKVAVAVAETVDAVEEALGLRRSGSITSVDFFDPAPAGNNVMDVCPKCNEQVQDYLTQDPNDESRQICKRCYERTKAMNRVEAKKALKPKICSTRLSGRSSQYSSDELDSPPYVRLSSQHKFVKKRQTVYEDPGNPFATGEVDLMHVPFSPLPPTPPEEWPIRKVSSSLQPQAPSRARHAGPCLPLNALLNGRPFDGAVETPLGALAPGLSSTPITPVILAPKPQRRSGTPTFVKQHRRSLSASALPPWLQPAEEKQEAIYVSPREGWKKGSIPAARNLPAIPRPGDEEVRNTKFYGFYDDLLDDLEGR